MSSSKAELVEARSKRFSLGKDKGTWGRVVSRQHYRKSGSPFNPESHTECTD